MTGIAAVGVGCAIICVWLWFSYRAASADRFDIRPMTDEERHEVDEFMKGL